MAVLAKRGPSHSNPAEGDVYYVYILRSVSKGTLYVGTTADVHKRLRQHNAGYCRSTAPYRPYQIVHVESYETLGEARKREWHLKCTPAGGKEKNALAARIGSDEAMLP